MWISVTRKVVLVGRNRLLTCGRRWVHDGVNIKHGEDVVSTRNIGIMAHIDAGKTTTTERMLFYSGFSRVLGDVDDGDTVTDYLEEERERGITITSAAITFNWLRHRINLIDTPGHVDFTVEVERALRVLDGAVTILDAATGVEAQTVTVWRQAERYNVPRIVYLNKMDKSRADVGVCRRSMELKLGCRPLLMHLPLFDRRSRFTGVVDLLSMTQFEWLLEDDPSGRVYKRCRLSEQVSGERWRAATERRRQLVELIADLDDALAELLLSSEDPDSLSSADLESAVRRITLAHKAVPVFCGSSYKNVGVQLLLDAVIKYLPSPNDIQHEFLQFYQAGLCSLAFKIIHDKQKGRLTFLRLYSGGLKRGQPVFNASRGCAERVGKIYVVYADQFEEVESIGAGNIVAVTGLSSVVTGDTLVGSQRALSDALKRSKDEPVLAGVEVPQPVFFCAIEPASLSQQTPLDNALQQIQLEDPSVRVTTDPDTGQTILAGMGELHIEIIRHRLEREFRVEADVGRLQVAYHETLREGGRLRHVHDKSLGSSKHHVVVELSVEPVAEVDFRGVRVAVGRETRENVDGLRPGHVEAVERGVRSGLSHGPLLGYPVTGVGVWLHWCEVGGGTSTAMITAAAAHCLSRLLSSSAQQRLMEPVMRLEIVTDERYLNAVLADLSTRRADILEVSARADAKTVSALVPLAELMNYSTSLRILASGTAAFTMAFHSYQLMSLAEQHKAIASLTHTSI